MHRIHLTYSLGTEEAAPGDLQHPLLHLLDAIHRSGSISAAAREVDLSYRHVWGELKRWEQELGQPRSHGCVRQARANAENLWNWAPNGTVVRVTR